MKKIISVVLALVIAFSVMSVMALAETPVFVTYEILSEEDKTCEVTGAHEGLTRLEVPKVIDGYTVVSIANRAFNKNEKAVSIAIPDTVKRIGQYAFSGTGYYKNSENWENGVLYLGQFLIDSKNSIEGEYTVKEDTVIMADAAFREAKKLTKVILPEGLEAISFLAFRDCTALTEVVIPSSVKSISGYAFTGCTALENITLPEGVETIGKYAFNGSGLTEITIPASVKEIGKYCFCHSNNLAAINVDENNEVYSSSTGVLFDKEQTTVVYCPRAIDYSEVQIPETITAIGDGAFEGISVEEIAIPDGVTSIGAAAFANSETLTKVTIPDSVTEIGEDAFGNSPEVSIIANEGSFAYGYAEENGLLPEIVWGDVNGDGVLSSLDARYVLQYIARIRAFTATQFELADVNFNGKVEALDARWILQAVVGIKELGPEQEPEAPELPSTDE